MSLNHCVTCSLQISVHYEQSGQLRMKELREQNMCQMHGPCIALRVWCSRKSVCSSLGTCIPTFIVKECHLQSNASVCCTVNPYPNSLIRIPQGVYVGHSWIKIWRAHGMWLPPFWSKTIKEVNRKFELPLHWCVTVGPREHPLCNLQQVVLVKGNMYYKYTGITDDDTLVQHNYTW